LKCASCGVIWRHINSEHAATSEKENKTKPIATPPPAYDAPPLPPPHMARPPFSTPPYFRQEHVIKPKKRSFIKFLFLMLLVIGGIIFYNKLDHFPSLSNALNEWQKQWIMTYSSVKNSVYPFKKTETALSLHVLTSNLSLQGSDALIKVKVQISNNTETQQSLVPLKFKLIDKDPNDETEFIERETWEFPLEPKILKPGEEIIVESSTVSSKKDPPYTVIVSLKE
jgi:hypothetical protein